AGEERDRRDRGDERDDQRNEEAAADRYLFHLPTCRTSITDPKSRPGYGTDRSRCTRAERSDAIKKDAARSAIMEFRPTRTELMDRCTSRIAAPVASPHPPAHSR